MEMNRNITQRWIDALRSGHYKQGLGRLKEIKADEEGNQVPHYCCLGVLCEVVAQDRLDLNVNWVDADYYSAQIKGVRSQASAPGDREFSYPTREILDAAGIDHEFSRQLANMNDHYKYDFNIIAAILEQALNSATARMAMGIGE